MQIRAYFGGILCYEAFHARPSSVSLVALSGGGDTHIHIHIYIQNFSSPAFIQPDMVYFGNPIISISCIHKGWRLVIVMLRAVRDAFYSPHSLLKCTRATQQGCIHVSGCHYNPLSCQEQSVSRRSSQAWRRSSTRLYHTLVSQTYNHSQKFNFKQREGINWKLNPELCS